MAPAFVGGYLARMEDDKVSFAGLSGGHGRGLHKKVALVNVFCVERRGF